LVYVALASKDGTECKELRLNGNRKKIRNYTVLNSFDMIRRWLMNNKSN